MPACSRPRGSTPDCSAPVPRFGGSAPRPVPGIGVPLSSCRRAGRRARCGRSPAAVGAVGEPLALDLLVRARLRGLVEARPARDAPRGHVRLDFDRAVNAHRVGDRDRAVVVGLHDDPRAAPPRRSAPRRCPTRRPSAARRSAHRRPRSAPPTRRRRGRWPAGAPHRWRRCSGRPAARPCPRAPSRRRARARRCRRNPPRSWSCRSLTVSAWADRCSNGRAPGRRTLVSARRCAARSGAAAQACRRRARAPARRRCLRAPRTRTPATAAPARRCSTARPSAKPGR